MRLSCMALLAGLAMATLAGGQEKAWRFRFQAGQTWTYRIKHNTNVAEVVGGSKVTTSSKLDLLKQWKILKVDNKGIATIQLSLAAMRNEQVRPNGDVLLFDSKNPDKSSPGLKEQMMKFINTPLAQIKVAPRGTVVDAEQGHVSRYEAEPPFQCILPAAAPSEGEAWQREYQITLNPPLGTGEKYDAVQHYRCAEINGPRARITLTTKIKNMPESPLDRVPLIQKQPQGELIYDIQSGRLQSATIHIERTLKDHQGKGSSYHFVSDYQEELVTE